MPAGGQRSRLIGPKLLTYRAMRETRQY